MESGIIFEFDPAKDAMLRERRGIGFERIIALIEAGCLIRTLEHPNKEKYGHQHIYEVDVEGYVHIVPFIKKGKRRILITVYPSRKATGHYKERET